MYSNNLTVRLLRWEQKFRFFPFQESTWLLFMYLFNWYGCLLPNDSGQLTRILKNHKNSNKIIKDTALSAICNPMYLPQSHIIWVNSCTENQVFRTFIKASRVISIKLIKHILRHRSYLGRTSNLLLLFSVNAIPLQNLCLVKMDAKSASEHEAANLSILSLPCYRSRLYHFWTWYGGILIWSRTQSPSVLENAGSNRWGTPIAKQVTEGGPW